MSSGIGYAEAADSGPLEDFSCPVIIANALGYIPGIGAIIGIARLIFEVCFITCLESPCKPLPVIRAFVEIAGLGILFLPFDIFASRHCHWQEECY